MRRKSTLLFSLLFIFLAAGAQNITGIWRGYFIQKSFGIYEDRYKFEIQIEQSPTNSIKGVTYSYKTTVFYGKATLQGIYTKKTKNVVINELKLVELKIGEDSQPCLMTCYLDYDKMGRLETLSGTYTSRNVKDKGDCGSGKVYLEKTTTSDFYKEDFLVKKENELKRKSPPIVKRTIPTPQPNTLRKPAPSTNKPKEPLVKTLPKVKPGAERNIITKVEKPKEKTTDAPIAQQKKEDLTKSAPVERKLPPPPDVIRRRNNELVKTFQTSAKEIKIELYDNGEIDGDTITVYHNNQLILWRKRLTDKPLTFTIKVDENEPHHEFVMVAENLGTIPPNTALMIITAGSRRYETHVTSTEKKNAMVVLEYKPTGAP
ncbi:MAG TPA: hypothetical protein VF622_10500 [Segetibacter sp.]|jgi:hypothetical protein